LLVEWNQTKLDYPQDACIHQIFETQVEQTPQAIAAVFNDQYLTYSELNKKANQLAHHLRSLGVEKETPIGISLDRSLEMVVGLLGILKAGGTYIPLDPLFPPDRLDYMLENSETRILLTQERLRPKTTKENNLLTVYLDSDWHLYSQYSVENPNITTQPHNLAYIIYTSGSTGKPKGVQLPHQGVVNFLTSMRQKPGLTADDTLLSVTTLSFDISVLEIFLPLTTGACVVVVPGEAVYDGAALIQQLSTNSISIMQATPATWQMLIDAGWQGDKNLKVLCGGEAMPKDLAKWLTQNVDSVWNMYGPTETTVWSTIYEITRDTDIITIGRPIANTQIYILDKNLEPTPIGVVGELYISGDGVARGYLKQPTLTAEKFVPDPFSQKPGTKMYRTGDQARYLTDGQIDFLGRVDFQVKVRGFRIELGEIETVLNHHPDIHKAVVIVREDSPDDKRLVAYLIPETDRQPDAGELRLYIRTKLPEYMMPSSYVFLKDFPMTPNRKVNHKALPVPDKSHLKTEGNFIYPRTATEEKLAKIWANVLGIEKIDVYDNFFDLGGHSLLATRVISRIRDQFKIDLPLRTLFMTPTVADISEAVDTVIWATQKNSISPGITTDKRNELEI
jgi:amino acid adenylation domain-containing protein